MIGTIIYNDMEILPPKSDLVFKSLFGTEESKELLREFLNDMLDLDIKHEDEISIDNNELNAKYDMDKLSRLDIRISTVKNEHINIEIQINDENNITTEVYIIYQSYILHK